MDSSRVGEGAGLSMGPLITNKKAAITVETDIAAISAEGGGNDFHHFLTLLLRFRELKHVEKALYGRYMTRLWLPARFDNSLLVFCYSIV